MARKLVKHSPVKQKRGRKPGNGTRGKSSPGKLARTGSNGIKAHQEAAGEARSAQRVEQALPWLDQGLTYEQIGARLGVTAKTVCLDLGKWHDRITESIKEKIEHRRTREERKSLMRDRAVMPQLFGEVPRRQRMVGRGKARRLVEEPPDPTLVVRAIQGAHKQLTNNARFRADLFGLNAPLKITPTDLTGTRRYNELSDAELLAERARLATLLGEGASDVGSDGADGNGGPPRWSDS